MKWQKARVGLGCQPNSVGSGELATCEECEHAAFFLFRIGGHRDVFCQCRNCGRVEAIAEHVGAPLTMFVPVPAGDEDTVHPFADQEGE